MAQLAGVPADEAWASWRVVTQGRGRGQRCRRPQRVVRTIRPAGWATGAWRGTGGPRVSADAEGAVRCGVPARRGYDPTETKLLESMQRSQRRCGGRSERSRRAAACGGCRGESVRMAEGRHRLVRCVQRALESWERTGATGRLAPRDIAELESRVARLRASGYPFWHVRLSPYVSRTRGAGEPCRAGGAYVATEV